MATEFHAFKTRLGASGNTSEKIVSGKKYIKQTCNEYTLVMCECGIGKVCSSTVAAIMIGHFNVDVIILAGVAGGLKTGIAVGDLVVVDSVIQHDFDCRPFFSRHTVPSIQTDVMLANKHLVEVLNNISKEFLRERYFQIIPQNLRESHNLPAPTLYVGCSIAGDKFLENDSAKAEIKQRIPNAITIEMEGGAVGQVCYETNKPFVSLRVVSDLCDGNGLSNYDAYCADVASEMLYAVLSDFIGQVAGKLRPR